MLFLMDVLLSAWSMGRIADCTSVAVSSLAACKISMIIPCSSLLRLSASMLYILLIMSSLSYGYSFYLILMLFFMDALLPAWSM